MLDYEGFPNYKRFVEEYYEDDWVDLLAELLYAARKEGWHDQEYQEWKAERIKESDDELAQMNADYEAGLGVLRNGERGTS